MDHDTCHNLLDSLSSYVEHDLSPELCLEIERHLAGCENCRVVINTLRKTIDLYHDTTPAAVVPDDVLERLYVRLEIDEYLKE
jgi:predicted anti-sigma-YlaC factor YlaD